MRLSFYTYSYTDRQEMPIEPCLERIASVGYSGIDVSGTHGRSDDPKSFDENQRRVTKELTEKLELRVEGVITHGVLTDTLVDPDRTPLDLKGTVDLADELDATVVTFHMGGYCEGAARDTLWRMAVDAIKAAADYGASRQISVAVDGIWHKWMNNTPDELERLFDDVDSEGFGVNFDPCYLTLMGVDPVEFAGRFRDRIVHAHLKDHEGGDYSGSEHRLPGFGEMDYERVFRALAELGFEHSLAIECFTDMEFAEACDSCYAAMCEAAGPAGMEFSR